MLRLSPGGFGIRERRHRVADLERRIGRQISDLRLEASLSQARLARCAGIAQSYLWKIEAGLASPSIDVLVAIGGCLGADLGIRYFPGIGPRLHDRFQAPMLEALIGRLGSPWQSQPEVPVPAARGVIDLVLRRTRDHHVIACECHSELRRLELVVRRAMEKTEALRGLDDDGAVVSTMLLLRSTEATRAVARAYERTLRAAFPARTREALDALAGSGPWPGPAIIWSVVEGGKATLLDRPPRGILVGR